MHAFCRWAPALVVGIAVGCLTSARAAETDKYLPSDAEVVLTIDVHGILQSPLFTKDLGKIREEMNRSPEHKSMEALGFDPLKDLDSIEIASPGAKDPERVMLLAHGRFNTEKIQSNAPDIAKQKGVTLTPLTENGYHLYEITTPDQQKSLYGAVLDASTIAVSTSKEAIVDTFEIKAGKKQARLGKAMQDLLPSAGITEGISVVGLGTALKGMPIGEKIDHFAGGIDLHDGLEAKMNIVATDAKAATSLSQTVKDGLEQAKGMVVAMMAMSQKDPAPVTKLFDAIKVSEEEKTVKIDGKVSKEVLEKMAEQQRKEHQQKERLQRNKKTDEDEKP